MLCLYLTSIVGIAVISAKCLSPVPAISRCAGAVVGKISKDAFLPTPPYPESGNINCRNREILDAAEQPSAKPIVQGLVAAAAGLHD
jgi:hypothetical protein